VPAEKVRKRGRGRQTFNGARAASRWSLNSPSGVNQSANDWNGNGLVTSFRMPSFGDR
jgi:hypothetical protein